MSVVSGVQPDCGFWEFANCGRCQRPFTSIFGATVPFWLTECGHIVCNSHLNADQSCSICGAPGIQLVPLQREMDAPMSEWFQSVPMCLDAVANAAKFQHETMASQIRYYRTRHQQQRVFIDRLKHDVGELRKDNERLNNENSQLREQLGGHSQYLERGYGDPVSERQDVVNSNGKRPRTEAHPYDYRQGLQATTSSPRSTITPLGPTRLTLPHGQPAPNLSFGNVEKNNNSSSHADPPRLGAGASQMQHRPASGFIDKYAYVPSATPQFRPQQLTHAQAAPQTFKRTKPDQDQRQTQSQRPPQNQGHRSMPPPPTPTRFKAARAPVASNNLTNQFSHPSQVQAALGAHPEPQQQQSMVKPVQSTRQRSGNPQTALGHIHDTSNPNSGRTTGNRSPGANRFFPTVQQSVSLSSAAQATSVGNGPQRFVPSSSRAPSRAQRPNFAGGGQRIPFVSHG